MRTWNRYLLFPALAAAVVIGACSPSDERGRGADMDQSAPGSLPGNEPTGTAGTAGMANLDSDIDSFLDDYIAMDDRFADNTLDFDVDNRVVRVSGDVDSDAERSALIDHLEKVPGVNRVESTDLKVKEAREGAERQPEQRRR